jgi:hypothetical protein
MTFSLHARFGERTDRRRPVDSGIVRWSEPLIADVVFAAYGRRFGRDTDVSVGLARRHCRLWRNLFHNEAVGVRHAQGDLMKAAAAAGLRVEDVESVDGAIFDELIDIILRRSQSSRETARSDGVTLVRAAAALGAFRVS